MRFAAVYYFDFAQDLEISLFSKERLTNESNLIWADEMELAAFCFDDKYMQLSIGIRLQGTSKSEILLGRIQKNSSHWQDR